MTKDLYDIMNSNYYSTEHEYYCDVCFWEGDNPKFIPVNREFDDEGYPITDIWYVSSCPECNNTLNEGEY